MPRRSRRDSNFENAGRIAAAITSHPREFVAILTATIATGVIIANALFLQKGPHPAPIFAAKPLLQQSEKAVPSRLPAQAAATDTAQPRIQLIANIQKELTRKGFYDGPADGIWGARTDGAGSSTPPVKLSGRDRGGSKTSSDKTSGDKSPDNRVRKSA